MGGALVSEESQRLCKLYSYSQMIYRIPLLFSPLSPFIPSSYQDFPHHTTTLPQSPAHGTIGLALLEPLEDARVVELVAACSALELWQARVRGADDAVADGALLHSIKLLLNVLVPQVDSVIYGPVLVAQEGPHAQQPFSQDVLTKAKLGRVLHFHWPQREAGGQPNHKLLQ